MAAPGGRDKVIWVGLAVRGRVAPAWAAALAAMLEQEQVQLARAGWVVALRPRIFRGRWALVEQATPAVAMGARWLAATCLRATRPMGLRPWALARRVAKVVGLLARRGRDSRRWRRGLWAARRGRVWAGALAWARAAAKVRGVGRAWARLWAKVLARGRVLGQAWALARWVAVCLPRGEALGACLLVWQRVLRRAWLQAFQLAFRLAWVPGGMLGLMRRLRSRHR